MKYQVNWRAAQGSTSPTDVRGSTTFDTQDEAEKLVERLQQRKYKDVSLTMLQEQEHG